MSLSFYGAVRRAAWIVSVPLFRLRVEGAERFPPTGPAVVVAQHRSWLDPLCVGCACRREVRFLILEKIYRKPWARWFYRGMQGIPVSPGGGRPLASLRQALRHLRQGAVIGLFPEGRVFSNEKPGAFQPGAALLALHAGAPIVPVIIEGSAEAWPRGCRMPRPRAVRVCVGVPIAPGEGRGRGAVVDLTRRIEQALGRVVDVGEELSCEPH